MDMTIDEARQHGPPVQVDHLCIRRARGDNGFVGANSEHSSTADRDCLRDGERRIDGHDLAVVQDHVGISRNQRGREQERGENLHTDGSYSTSEEIVHFATAQATALGVPAAARRYIRDRLIASPVCSESCAEVSVNETSIDNQPLATEKFRALLRLSHCHFDMEFAAATISITL
jgi:hypothetical protein